MLPFLIDLNENDIASSNTSSMIEIIQTKGLQLEVELACVMDCCSMFIEGTYYLEGIHL
jgi:hypothetical protein